MTNVSVLNRPSIGETWKREEKAVVRRRKRQQDTEVSKQFGVLITPSQPFQDTESSNRMLKFAVTWEQEQQATERSSNMRTESARCSKKTNKIWMERSIKM